MRRGHPGRAVLVYLAGPLFSEAERCFNERLAGRLEAAGFRVFLPQRDGVERDKPPYDEMPREERRSAMFRLDEANMLESDVFLLVLDGRVPDQGACVELGIAHCHKKLRAPDKLLVGLHTDTRAAFIGSKLNPMPSVPLEHVAGDEEALLGLWREFRNSRRVATGRGGPGSA